MRKIIQLLTIFIFLLFFSCEKDELLEESVIEMNETFTVDGEKINVSVSQMECDVKVRNVNIVLSKSQDMKNPVTFAISVDNKTLLISGLEDNTEYFYYFHLSNNVDYANTEVSSFKTEFRYKVMISVNDSLAGTVSSSIEEGRFDDIVQVVATPSRGYYFVGWNDNVKESIRKFKVGETSKYVALFARESLKLSTEIYPANCGEVEGTGSYFYGDTAKLIAFPTMTYRFVKWSDGDTNAHRSIKIMENLSLIAYFAKASYNMILNTSPSAGGIVSGSGKYLYGELAQIIALASVGYKFSKWNDGNLSQERNVRVVCDTSLIAIFDKESYKLDLSSSPSEGGLVSENGVYSYGEMADIEAVPSIGYEFSNWSDGDNNSRRSVKMTMDTSLKAIFKKLNYNLKFNISPSIGGIVSGTGSYSYGETANINAIPTTGYEFSNWSDGETDPQRSIIITKDSTLTAYFKKQEYNLILNSSPLEGGVVSGAGSYSYGETVNVEAIPSIGYKFSNWSDGNVENSRLIKMNKHLVLTAIFEKEESPDVDSYKWFHATHSTSLIPIGLKLVDKQGVEYIGDGIIKYEVGKEYRIIDYEYERLNKIGDYIEGDLDLNPLKDKIKTFGTFGVLTGLTNVNFYADQCDKLESIQVLGVSKEAHLPQNVKKVSITGSTIFHTSTKSEFEYMNFPSGIEYIIIQGYLGEEITFSTDILDSVVVAKCPNLKNFNNYRNLLEDGTARLTDEALGYFPKYIHFDNCPNIKTIFTCTNQNYQPVKIEVRDMENLSEMICHGVFAYSHKIQVDALVISNCLNLKYNDYYVNTIDLNDEWEVDFEQNMDPTNFDCYRSFSNHYDSDKTSTMNFINDGSSIVFYVRGYSDEESCYDYVTVKTDDGSSIATTRCNSDWVEIETSYLGKIFVEYRKNGSGSAGTDRGYLMIPKFR